MPMKAKDVQQEVSVKIKSIDQDNSYHYYIVHFQVMDFEIKLNDFNQVLYLKDETSSINLKEFKRLKDMNVTLTGYLKKGNGDNLYYLNIPEFNFDITNFLFGICSGGKQFYLKDGKYYGKE